MIVTSDRKREAALDAFACWVGIRTLESAASEHCLLCVVKGNSTKFLPVTDELILNDNFMNGKFSLWIIVSMQ